MENRDWRDIARRAGKTFVQAAGGAGGALFLGACGLNPTDWYERCVTSPDAGKAVFVVAAGAFAAGLAAVWNTWLSPKKVGA